MEILSFAKYFLSDLLCCHERVPLIRVLRAVWIHGLQFALNPAIPAGR